MYSRPLHGILPGSETFPFSRSPRFLCSHDLKINNIGFEKFLYLWNRLWKFVPESKINLAIFLVEKISRIASKEIQWCNYYCFTLLFYPDHFLLKNSIYCFFFFFLHTIHSSKSTSIILRYIQKSYNMYAYRINKRCDPKKKIYIYIKGKRKETKEKKKEVMAHL